mmetsp:Transcript_8226/g.25487  ORF Transcript_8226/g.25487 Transcript_8226/m.25487 type:complete len:310 (+) Transcript_8226:83-1012(+)
MPLSRKARGRLQLGVCFGFVVVLYLVLYISLRPASGPLSVPPGALRAHLPSGIDVPSTLSGRTLSKQAFVLVLTSATELPGARVLAYSLAQTQSRTSPPLVALCQEGCFSEAQLALLGSSGFAEVFEAPEISVPSVFARDHSWFLLRVWQLEQYERVVVLLPSFLVLQSIEELFKLELPNGAIAATRDCCDRFDPSLMVICPSRSLLQQMLDQLSERHRVVDPHTPDRLRFFLNELFADRWRALPFTYRATADTFASGYWKAADMKLIHFNNVLPFSHEPMSPSLEYLLPLHDRWWDAYGVLEPDLRID